MADDFGSDISVFPDLDPTWTVQTDERVVAGEAIAKRLTTPAGSLIDDPAYGFDVFDLLEADLDDSDLARIRGQVQLQAEADERVIAVGAVDLELVGETLTIRIRLVLADGPFTLVLVFDRLLASVSLLIAA